MIIKICGKNKTIAPNCVRDIKYLYGAKLRNYIKSIYILYAL